MVPHLQTSSIPISNTYKTDFLSMKVSSLSSMVTTKNYRSNLLNIKEEIHRILQQMCFNKEYNSYHYSRSISSQHKKRGSTHQSLACTTERVGLLNLPE